MRGIWSLLLAALVACACAGLGEPAFAFTVQGESGEETQNAYGLWYGGAGSCDGADCHDVITNVPTVHSRMVTDVRADPALLVPSADSGLWLAPSAGGLAIGPSDVYLKVGDGLGLLQYVGTPETTRVAVTPTGDLPVWSPVGFEQDVWDWELPATPVGGKSYNQSCSGCHNLGLTRPSASTYTLPSGGIQTSSTPTAVNSLSIQCEVCHGSGENPSTHATGTPETVGGLQVLDAQVCGQCHVTGTAPQKGVAGTFFGNPNGYTVDEELSDYLAVPTSTPTESQFASYLAGDGAKPKFLPNGSNYSMRHSYYNEWLNNKAPNGFGHANPRNTKVMAGTDTRCLGCHSGIGFLQRIGARTAMGSLIVTDVPTIAQAAASDVGISCQVCHRGHIGYKVAGGYDLARTWGSGTEVSCGDCHNWQFEVLGQAVQTETVGVGVGERPAANTRVRHPQREMQTGGRGGASKTGGMWGVAAAGEFMPGTTCNDCHMPRTHKEGMPVGDDGSIAMTRVSHRFHPVLPGDAERWQLRDQGDSCAISACHENGEPFDWTRADFQRWIDQTQSDTSARSDEVTQTLDAVAVGLGMSGWAKFIASKPSTPPASGLSGAEWKMLQKAAQNADFVINDASGGVHQPSYARAGLDRALAWADGFRPTFEATPSATFVNAAEGITISGTLEGQDGAAIAGATVTLQASTDGGRSWSSVRSSAVSGKAFSFTTGPVAGDVSFRCAFAPDLGVAYTTEPIDLSVPVTGVITQPADATDGWSAVDVTFSLVPSDVTGLTFVGMTGATTRAPQIYGGPVTVSEEGTTTVTFWTVGPTGSEALRAFNVRIDKSGPAVTCGSTTQFVESASLKVDAADALSGVEHVECSLDGGPWVETIGSSCSIPPVTSLGAHTLAVKGTDNLGNVGQRSHAFTVRAKPKITTAPTSYTSYVGLSRSWATGVLVKRANGAPLSGVKVSLQRSKNNSSWSTYCSLRTMSTGKAAASVRCSTRGKTYWRWVVSADTRSLSAVGGTKVVVVR